MNSRLHRFTIIFDREGYSPQFMAEMREERIAVISYHKFPGPDWPSEEFVRREVRLINGAVVKLDMAERGICLSNGLWVAEVRQREERGHQTSILASDYVSLLDAVAVGMFARWDQSSAIVFPLELAASFGRSLNSELPAGDEMCALAPSDGERVRVRGSFN